MWPKLLIILMSVSLATCGGFASNGLSQDSFIVPTDWRKVDLGRMVLFLPPTMDRRDVTGVDSQIWEFRNGTSRLIVNLGEHTDDLITYEDWPEFHQENVRIDSYTAKLCTFRHSEQRMDSADDDRLFLAAAYFPKIPAGQLTLLMTSKNPGEQRVAKTIFYSIKFKNL